MKHFLYFTLLLAFSQVFTKTYIRYNQLGYHYNQQLKFVIISDESLTGKNWFITNSSNESIESKVITESQSGKSAYTSKKYNYLILPNTKLKAGKYTFSTGLESINFSIVDHISKTQVENIIRYLRAKRSGETANYLHHPSHLGDTNCIVYTKRGANRYWGKTKKKVNMTGGWYDAGDYIKFTLTNAYTTYVLIKALEKNPDFFSNSSIKEEIKFGLKYLSKTLPSDYTFIIQTGGYLDHQQELRLPETDLLDGKREAYSSLSSTQMGYTCAALSIGAKNAQLIGIDEETRKEYSELTKRIYVLAKENITKTAWWQGNEQELTQTEKPNMGGTGWENFYADDSPYDNMSLAALELFRLTKSKNYKKDAVYYAKKAGPGWWASWGNCNMYANNGISKLTGSTTNALKEDISNFQSISTQKGNLFGRPHDVTWGTLNSILIVGNNMATYDFNNHSLSHNKTYNDVYNYVFGLNNWGIAFVSDTTLLNSFKKSYSPLYRLQPELVNIGEVSPGPGDRPSHEDLGFNYGLRWEDEFNTSKTIYYDESTDFMTAETTITLVADMIYFLAIYDRVNR